jgi:hypothetical protein
VNISAPAKHFEHCRVELIEYITFLRRILPALPTDMPVNVPHAHTVHHWNAARKQSGNSLASHFDGSLAVGSRSTESGFGFVRDGANKVSRTTTRINMRLNFS